jgi:hypothetical protein
MLKYYIDLIDNLPEKAVKLMDMELVSCNLGLTGLS